MGVLGRYIDGLPDEARDRIIRAQDWCVAEVAGPGEARCLVGHAEDWRPLAAEGAGWRRWAGGVPVDPVDALCAPEIFAFRRARPADLAVYRARLERLGPASEGAIGARFDRLCARLGTPAAVRLVKARAAGAAPALSARPPSGRTGSGRGRRAGAGTR